MTLVKSTLTDVARRVGVSRYVAGHVLNGGRGNSRVGPDLRTRIIAAAAELDYHADHAATLLRGKRSMTYGLLVESSGDPLRSFLVQYLDEHAVRRGCRLLIGNTIVDPGAFSLHLLEFRQRRVDGVLCAMLHLAPEQRAQLLEQFPHTVFYGDDEPDGMYIMPDQVAIGQMAVAHLHASGCRRIGCIFMVQCGQAESDRLSGYTLGLRQCGLAGSAPLIHLGGLPRRHFAWEMSEKALAFEIDQAIDQVVNQGGADGLLVHNDFWASQFLRRLRFRGVLVPHQVQVIGAMNHYLAEWTDPPLSTVDFDNRAAAFAMIEALESSLNSSNSSLKPQMFAPPRVKIQPKIISRGSTRPVLNGQDV